MQSPSMRPKLHHAACARDPPARAARPLADTPRPLIHQRTMLITSCLLHLTEKLPNKALELQEREPTQRGRDKRQRQRARRPSPGDTNDTTPGRLPAAVPVLHSCPRCITNEQVAHLKKTQKL